MKQFLAIVFLGLLIAYVIDARPGRGRGRKRGQKECSGSMDYKRGRGIVRCETNEDCGTGKNCSTEAVTLTFNGTDIDVKVCQKEGYTPSIAGVLMKKSCKVLNATDFAVKPELSCCDDDESCSSSAVSFAGIDGTVSATFCQEEGEEFDLNDFLASLAEKKRGKHSSESSESEESEESEEMTTTPQTP